MSVRKIIAPILLAWAGLGLQASGANPVLHLHRGGSVPGGILGFGEDGSLEWESPFFGLPMKVPLGEAGSVSFPYAKVQYPSGLGTYEARTIQGDNLHGKLLQVTPDVVKLETQRHGLVMLQREHVSSLRHLHGHWLYSSANQANWERGGWNRKDGRQLVTQIRNAQVSDTLTFEQPFHIHFNISWEGRPNFMLSISQHGGARKPGIKASLEVWGDRLVLVHNKEFLQLDKFGEGEAGQAEYHVYIDPSKSSTHVYDGKFARLGSLESNPGPQMDKFDFRFQNRTDNLAIGNLEFTNWHGQPPAGLGEAPILFGQEGNLIHGYLHTFEATNGFLFIPGRPLMDVKHFHSVNFRPMVPGQSPAQGDATLVFNDTTRITGKLVALTKSMAKLRIPASKEPIQCNLSDLATIQWHTNPELPPSNGLGGELDILGWEDGYLMGNILKNAKDGHPLAWRPSFGGDPIPLDTGADFSVGRAKVKEIAYSQADYPVMLHLANRMEIPAKVKGYEDGHISIASPFLPTGTKLQDAKIRAIRFPTPAGPLLPTGKWRLMDGAKAKIQAKEGKLEIHSKATFQGTPKEGDSLDFEIQGLAEGEFSIRITSPGDPAGKNAEEDTEPFLELIKARGDRDFVVNVHHHGGMEEESHYIYNRGRPSAKVRLEFGNKTRIKVNGDSHASISFDSSRPVLLHISPEGGTPLHLDSGELAEGTLAFPAPADIAKTLILPRLSAKSPPPHILAAQNGDLLRGQLIGITGDSLLFKSAKRKVEIPAERCSLILWMTPQFGASPQPIGQETARIVLGNGLSLPMTPTHIQDGNLHGTSGYLGECQAPFESISIFHFGKSGQIAPLPTFDPWKYTVNTPQPND